MIKLLRKHVAAVLSFLLGLALLATAFVLAFHNTSQMLSDAAWRQHTYQVIAETRGVLSGLLDGETAERGYYLTGEPASLAVFHQARHDVTARIQNLRQLTADNPRQQRDLAALEPAAMTVFDALARSIEQKRVSSLSPN